MLSNLCEEILDLCLARTVERYGKNSCDNMTIIIVVIDSVCTYNLDLFDTRLHTCRQWLIISASLLLFDVGRLHVDGDGDGDPVGDGQQRGEQRRLQVIISPVGSVSETTDRQTGQLALSRPIDSAGLCS